MEAKDKGEEEETEEPEATEAVRHNNVVARAHTIKGGRILAFALDRDKAISFLALYSLSLYLSIYLSLTHSLCYKYVFHASPSPPPSTTKIVSLVFSPSPHEDERESARGGLLPLPPAGCRLLRYQSNVCRPGNNVKPGQHRPLRPSVSLSVSVSQFRIRPHQGLL